MEIGGRPALIASLMDVTARRRAEERVRDYRSKRERERNTAQRYLDIAGVMILVLNADESVALINRKDARILGYDEPAGNSRKVMDRSFHPGAHAGTQ